MNVPAQVIQTDKAIIRAMRRFGTPAMRIAIGIIFIWFGVLKPLGVSPASGLVEDTVVWLPFFQPKLWVSIIGWWEVAIGVCFLFRRTTRLAIALLMLQMVGTFMPLVFLPQVTFQAGKIPFAPTMEGQYIIKNLLIIAAAISIGGTVNPVLSSPDHEA